MVASFPNHIFQLVRVDIRADLHDVAVHGLDEMSPASALTRPS